MRELLLSLPTEGYHCQVFLSFNWRVLRKHFVGLTWYFWNLVTTVHGCHYKFSLPCLLSFSSPTYFVMYLQNFFPNLASSVLLCSKSTFLWLWVLTCSFSHTLGHYTSSRVCPQILKFLPMRLLSNWCNIVQHLTLNFTTGQEEISTQNSKSYTASPVLYVPDPHFWNHHIWKDGEKAREGESVLLFLVFS